MTSPVNQVSVLAHTTRATRATRAIADELEREQHRVLPTPRSALRSAVKPSSAGRRKSGRGFLQPPPSTIKRKSVVWDEKLYIQEIVDIRDKSMHWDAAVDGVEEERQQMSPVASGSQVRVVSTPPDD